MAGRVGTGRVTKGRLVTGASAPAGRVTSGAETTAGRVTDATDATKDVDGVGTGENTAARTWGFAGVGAVVACYVFQGWFSCLFRVRVAGWEREGIVLFFFG